MSEKFPYEKALAIANETVTLLAPHCERIEIAGSVRRQKPEVKDIEIVVIPKPFMYGLFEDGIATVVNKWEKVKGDLEKNCKYTQRILPSGIKLDLFFAERGNWGNIFAMRTGSADYSRYMLAGTWSNLGYASKEGYLYDNNGVRIEIREEEELFKLLSIPFAEPKDREYEKPVKIKVKKPKKSKPATH